MRCYFRHGNLDRPICGELARWERPGRDWFAAEYFCDAHRGPADIGIPGEHVLRRVRINVDVLLAGCAVNAPLAHVEALAKLEAAVRSVGGCLDVNHIGSHVVKSCPPPPVGWQTEPSGDPR